MAIIKLYTLGDNQLKYLQASKLFSIDNFSTWLAGIGTSTTISDVQYQKNALELGINLDLSQSYAQPEQKIHYVSIQNTGESAYYYYVKNTTWRSKSAVRLELVMDVLNTFKDGTDYTFKENTRIIREHKNRFKITDRKITIEYYITQQIGYLDIGDSITFINDHGDICFSGTIDDIDQYRCTITITSSETTENIETSINDFISDPFEINKNGANYYFISIENTQDYSIYTSKFRDIDYVNENINPILQCGSAEGEKIEHNKTLLQTDWYLLYRNTNDPDPDVLTNPVECYLIPNASGIQVDSGVIAGGRLIPSYLEENKFYFFRVDSGQTYTLSDGHTFSYGGGYNRYVMINKVGNKLTATFIQVAAGTPPVLTIQGTWDCDYMGVSPLPAYYAIDNYGFIIAGELSTKDYSNEFTNTLTYKELDDVSKVDRTDAKNIKLIKLPYCPYDFTIISNILKVSLAPEWEVVSLTQSGGGTIICLHLKDLNTNLHGTFSTGSNTNKNPLPNLRMAGFSPSLTDLRKDASYESKLFHSEFYQPTYFYDSFAFKIQLEKCHIDSYLSSRNLVINFDMTRTINSKFLFTFASYYLKNGEQNYANCMPIARNNEEVLYNVPYINYIRSGYQYDIKNKNISNISNAIGVGLSATSFAVSLAIPSVPLKVAGVVASAVSMAMSVKNAVVSAQQNENSISQKLTQYQNQTASVSGSDDVDLMSVYAENRLKYLVYEPTSNMKDLLFKLFFYAGYSANRMGVPTHNNRMNFDYLECDAVIEATNKNMTQEIINEIVNSYKNGVTFIHRTSRVTDAWDMEQKYENWEKIFFN